MQGFVPEDIVDRVRSATDIVELVSGYVSLKKTGANYSGLCPFHQEKTPSFSVSPSKQIFHCFGCGAGGDAIGFLIRYENLSFPEALERLAEKAGIKLPEAGGRAAVKADYTPLVRANELAAEVFGGLLWDSPEGAHAREYLKRRGFDKAAAAPFGMGYSPPGWDGLLTRLTQAGITAQVAQDAGLAIARSGGTGHYDRFRDRVTFTIRDVKGRVVGFGGRTMGDDTPKYLNSPETPLFKKGETLYLMDKASAEIRRLGYAVVTEGYFDAIACHRSGVGNAVATLGTALTAAHLRLLGRYAKNVLLVFDADPAGMKAAERSLEVFLPTGMTAKVAMLPPGDDPDSLMAREGAAGLKKRLGASEKLLDFVIRRAAEGAATIDEKVAASDKVTGVLASIPNAVERSQYIAVAAGALGVDERALAEELDKELRRRGRRAGAAGAGGKAGLGAKAARTASSKVEEELIHLALGHPEVAAELRRTIEPSDFSDPAMRAVAEGLFRLAGKDGRVSVGKLLDTIEDEQVKGVVLALSAREGGYEDPMLAAKGTMDRMLAARVDRKLRDLTERLRGAERQKDLGLLNMLQKEFVEWQKKKSSTR